MPTYFNKYYPLRTVVFFLGEGALIFLSLLAVDWIILGTGPFFLDLVTNAARAFLVTLIFQLCLYFFDLYDLSNEVSLPNTFTRMTQAFGVGCIILGGVYYSAPFMIISARIFWLGYLVICLSTSLWRGAYYLILRKRMFVQNILLVGTGTLASNIARLIEGVQDSVYRVKGFVGDKVPDYNPQLWNILKGDMSLVGPRPERQVFVDQLAQKIPYYNIRHEMKPGVTGWAQVCYPYGASELDALKKLEYDLYYMKNVSIGFDLLVIFKTVKTVLFKKGSR